MPNRGTTRGLTLYFEVQIVNSSDSYLAKAGCLLPERVRQIVLSAQVDTDVPFTPVISESLPQPKIGRIVLEALDLLIDPETHQLRPRDWSTMIVELETVSAC